MSLPGFSIPLAESAICLDCLVIFFAREKACPKCSAEYGIASVRISGSGATPENEAAPTAPTVEARKESTTT